MNEFVLELCSDLAYEGMVVDVCYGIDSIVSLNYDKGIDHLEIELLAWPEDAPRLAFPLDDFLEALQKAKSLAIRCAKEDEERKKNEQ